MGKDLIQQRRGRGSSTYRRHSFRSPGAAKLYARASATVLELIHSYMHTAPLARVKYADGTDGLIIATEGLRAGQTITIGPDAPLELGNTLPLQAMPEGSLIFNIESTPGDGGRFVRSSGAAARIVAKTADAITVQLPSKKRKAFHPRCMATLGIAAGGGRPEKPFLKAGKKFHRISARDKYWPVVSGAKMNAVDHPFGGKRSSRIGRPTIAPKNAPPGRKVGMLRPRHTGRNK